MPSEDYAAIVLAGGRSTRLGRDKASEPLLGVPLLQRVVSRLEPLVTQVVAVKARGQRLPGVHCRPALLEVEDAYPGAGPLGGLYTGLSAMKPEAAIAVACDMPLLSTALVAELLRLSDGYDVVIPISDDHPQPLCAVYRKRCLEPIRRRLEAGAFKLMGFYEDVNVLEVPPAAWRRFDPEGLSFQNLNREEDLQRAEAVLRAEDPATT
jgi:molybdopterin-guanine dinucleotide biosynthesis protein A